MKRLIVILLINLSVVSIFAQLTMPQLYKQWMIEDINKGDYQKALTEFEQADVTFYADEYDMQLDLQKFDMFATYAFYQSLTDEQMIAIYKYAGDYTYFIGDYSVQEEQYSDALQWFELAVQYFNTIQEFYPLMTVFANNMYANMLNRLENYSAAERPYIQALYIANEYLTDDSLNIRHTVVNNIIDNYLSLGDTINAEKYFLMNNPLTEPVDTSEVFSYMWKTLTDYHYFKSNYESSIIYCDKAIEWYNRINDFSVEVGMTWRKGLCYLQLQDTTRAIQIFHDAYQIAQSYDVTNHPIQFTLNSLAMAYYKIDDYENSFFYCRKLYEMDKRDHQAGADFRQTALDGLLICAIDLGLLDSVKYYIEFGADVNTFLWQARPLQHAIWQDNHRFADAKEYDVMSNAFVETLLKAGAKVDVIGSDLETAVLFEDYRLCKLLLDYGASPKSLTHDDRMNIIQYADSCGLKRITRLLKNPKTYNEQPTIQELNELFIRSHNTNDYITTEHYCEQALNQFYEEIDEPKYQGFRTRQRILFYYVSALVNQALVLEQNGEITSAESLVLRAIELDTERKQYSDHLDSGFADVDDILLRMTTNRDGNYGHYAGVKINALNEFVYRTKLGVKDRYYYYTLAEAAHYFKEHSIKESAREMYRQLLNYVSSTNHAIDSIGLTNYTNLIQDMAYLQKTQEDTLALQQEFINTELYIKDICGHDSACYYEYMVTLGWWILSDKELSKYMNKYLDVQDKSEIGYFDMQIMSLLFSSIEILNNRDTTAEAKYLLEAEKILPIIHNADYSVQHTFAEYWIWFNYDLAYRQTKRKYEIDNLADYSVVDTTYLQQIWSVVPIYFQINKRKIQDRLSTMSDEMAIDWLNYSNIYFTDQDIYLSTIESTPPSESVAAIYDNELFKKGLLLRNQDNLKRYLSEQSDTTASYLYNKIQQLKTQREMYRQQPFSDSIVNELSFEIDNKERILYNLSGKYQEQVKYDQVSWQDVCKNLNDGEVAIEFVNFGYIDQYFALLLRKGYDAPLFVRLSDFQNIPKEEIQQRWEFYQQNLDFCIENNSPSDLYPEPPHYLEFTGDANEVYKYGKNGTELYNALWQPLLEYINEGEIIYFSPTGVLHQLAIEALPISQTEVLADRYDLHRVSSTRELAMRSLDSSISNATLYGGIIYDISAESMEAESQKYDLSQLSLPTLHRGNNTDRGSVKYLPGTKQEVENISSIFKTKKIKHNLLKGEQANEESFKLMSGKQNDIIHIATHGFFWSDNDAKQKEYLQQRGIDKIQQIYINPLERCGLCLAGANLALRGHSNQLTTQGIQDGILTAQEISILDLSNTQLVVLSACETGLGEITSDGVFGLQRAFKQAGVQTIVMSLWKVDDETTQNFMTKFYQYWLAGETKHQAFHHAQNDIRKVKPNPYYWAAFIMLD